LATSIPHHTFKTSKGGSTDERILFLNVDGIDWIEAADNYVNIHTGNEAHLLHATLSRLEAKLNPREFLRVHRSTIVNLRRIRELHPLFR
jgi:two-component system, LytTR family, response regulator